jgi:hypothetical protein
MLSVAILGYISFHGEVRGRKYHGSLELRTSYIKSKYILPFTTQFITTKFMKIKSNDRHFILKERQAKYSQWSPVYIS